MLLAMAPPASVSFVEQPNLIESNSNATSVFAIDVDGDGDVDVVSALSPNNVNKIVWLENKQQENSGTITWTPTQLATMVDFPRLRSTSTATATSTWCRQPPVILAQFRGTRTMGAPPTWTTRNITTDVVKSHSVFAIDVDGDGDIDVLSADFEGKTIAWHENDGGTPAWTTHNISTNSLSVPYFVSAIDVDGDGDVDVLATDHWGMAPDELMWYENDGGTPPAWTPHIFGYGEFDDPISVFAIDVDGDGDADVVAGPLYGGVKWLENAGGTPPVWTPHSIAAHGAAVYSVFAIDVDGDGDIDVVTGHNDVEWVENDATPAVEFVPHGLERCHLQ